MITHFIARLLGRSPAAKAPSAWSQLTAAIRANPAAPLPHVGLARHFLAAERPLPAHACYRTALALGAPRDAVLEQSLHRHGITLVHSGARSDPPALAASNLEYQRLGRLAQRVRELLGSAPATILDVGGGHGGLALFLPEYDYLIAEPQLNGLGSEEAAGFGRTFDLVTCCHVLEHIPENGKNAFLDGLTRLARKHVLLLGPSIDADVPPPLDELFFRVTGQTWAAEHLACGWPRLDAIRTFARAKNLECRSSPNGDLGATYWMVFAAHYAALAGREHELAELFTFYNRRISPDPKAPAVPNDYLVELSHPSPHATSGGAS